MAELYRSDICDVDISKSLVRSYVGIVLATGDKNANRFGAVLNRAGEPVNLTGCSVMGYFIRPNSETVACQGVQEGSMVYVDLPAACYTEEGTFSLAVKVSSTEITQTVRVIDGCIRLTQTDTVVDPGEVVPSLDELLAHIAEMETVVAEAESIAAEAREIAEMAALPIIPEITGEVATVTDAIERDAVAVVSHIDAIQEGTGTASPTNIRPISGRNAVSLWHGAAYDEAAEAVCTTDLPETIYGGLLDWVTGVLTVTHVHYSLAVADMNAPYEKYPGWDGVPNLRKYMGAVNVVTGIASAWGNIGVHTLSSSHQQIILNNGTLLQSEWKTTYPDLVIDFVIPIVNTFTIQLTPNQLTMLKGSNAFWSDTGDTTVTYVADTKTYIDNKFTALQNAILAQGANI